MNSVTLEEIYKAYHDKVQSYILRKTQDIGVAEDLTSDVFVKLTKNIENYDPDKAAVSTWVYTIANNTVTDYFRTRKVAEELPNDSGEDGQIFTGLIDNKGVDTEILTQESLDVLAEALESLPKRSRDLIILHYYSGLTLKETAERLSMSYASAKSVHKTALNQLKLQIGDRI